MNEYDLLLREDLSSEKLLAAHSTMIKNRVEGKYNYNNWKWVMSPDSGEDEIIAVNEESYNKYKTSDGFTYFMFLEIFLITVTSLIVYTAGAFIYNYSFGDHWRGLLLTIAAIYIPAFMFSSAMPGTLSSLIRKFKYFDKRVDENFKKFTAKNTLMSIKLSGVSKQTQQNIVNFLNIYKDFGSSKNYNYVINDLVNGGKNATEIEDKYSVNSISAPDTYKMFAVKQLENENLHDLKVMELRAQKFQVQ